jgi:aminoglycoside phosphotransferase (APT) family kinase protein
VDSGDAPPLHLAPVLGRFLSWLHAFPTGEAARCGVPSQPIESLLHEIRAEALMDFDWVRKVAPEAPLEKWYAYLEAGVETGPPSRSAPTLVHNDLAAEHILVAPDMKTVTGVIDWSDMAVSDPAADFAGMFHWGGEPFVGEVLSAYRGEIAETVITRAKFMAACRGVADVVFGLETDRREYIAAGVRALRLCVGT